MRRSVPSAAAPPPPPPLLLLGALLLLLTTAGHNSGAAAARELRSSSGSADGASAPARLPSLRLPEPELAGARPLPASSGGVRSFTLVLGEGLFSDNEEAAPSSGDGATHRRWGLTVNGTAPGPVLEALEGETLSVTVESRLAHDNATLHWHGAEQAGTWFMDGVPGVTQCAIPPGGRFRYLFSADKPGTFWYHSHSRLQYVDGLLGALVVHPKPNEHDEEDAAEAAVLPEFVLLAHEWGAKPFRDVAGPTLDSGSMMMGGDDHGMMMSGDHDMKMGNDDMTMGNDHGMKKGGDHDMMMGGDNDMTMGNDHGMMMSGDHDMKMGNDDMTMGNDHGMKMSGDHDMMMGGDNGMMMGGNDHGMMMSGDHDMTMGNDHGMKMSGDHDMMKGGDNNMMMGGNDDMMKGGDKNMMMGSNDDMMKGGDHDMMMGGDNNMMKGGNDDMMKGGDNDMMMGGNNMAGEGVSGSMTGGSPMTMGEGHQMMMGRRRLKQSMTGGASMNGGISSMTTGGHDEMMMTGHKEEPVMATDSKMSNLQGDASVHQPNKHQDEEAAPGTKMHMKKDDEAPSSSQDNHSMMMMGNAHAAHDADFPWAPHLVNGKGGSLPPREQAQKAGGLEVVRVKAGGSARLRVINGSGNWALRLQIEGHVLPVLAADASPVGPQDPPLDYVLLGVGERMDILLTATETPGAYWIYLSSLSGDHVSHAVLLVEGEPHQGMMTQPVPSGPISPPDVGGPETLVDQAHALSAAPSAPPMPPLVSTGLLVSGGLLVSTGPGQRLRVYLTGQMMPTYNWDIDLQHSDASAAAAFGTGFTGQVIRLAHGDVVDLELINQTPMDHPIHKHGSAFWVLDVQSESSHDQHGGAAAHGAMHERPLFKDTVTVPRHGRALIRVKATDAGPWLFHCHTKAHADSGMMAGILVGDPAADWAMPPSPLGDGMRHGVC